MEYSDVRYLTSKRTVDDRALCQPVLQVVRDRVANRSDRLRVLELGGGPGTMVDRLIDWGVLGEAHYTIVDLDQTSLEEALRWRGDWARGRSRGSGPTPTSRQGVSVEVETVCAELLSWLEQEPDTEPYDLIIANAVLDLLDVGSILPHVWQRLRRDGLYWFSINFDGETVFLPELELDARVLAAYHRSMDLRGRDGRPAGDSKSGRHLFEHLTATGARILAAGSSDWVVYPTEGAYPAEEAYFLHHIIHTIDAELRTHPELEQALGGWVAQRHAQVDDGGLVYIAHQLDFVGTLEDGSQ
jgi:SAM-dependent methyltransferase